LGIDKSTYVRTEGSYGWKYDVEEVGYKYHGNDILAAIGRVSLRHVDEDNARRQEIVDLYREGLGDLPWLRFVPSVEYMESNPHIKSANHLGVVRVPRKREFIERMKKAGIDIGCHYRPNTHYPMYSMDDKKEVLPNTETLYKEIITLPLHLKLTDRDVEYIIKTIKDVWN
jgi:dTDP-4-amino-4,6-dideoxygalactose transaminase